MAPGSSGGNNAALGRLGAAALLIGPLVVVGFAGLVGCARSFGGWYLEDDILNARWVLEHRDDPWSALTELHAMHGHIRPLNLMSQWAGARLSDGEWWGPHALLSVLWLGVLGGTMVLASASRGPARSGAAVAAAVAGGLVLATGASAGVLTWNAWMGSAGEAACGVWAVVAVVFALRRKSSVIAVGALLAVVGAGLFKEPGWIIYPVTGALAAAVAWRRGDRGPATWILLSLPLVGVAGLGLVWNPANVQQYFGQTSPFPVRVWAGTAVVGRAVVGAWQGAGMVAPLLWWGLWRGVLRRSTLDGLAVDRAFVERAAADRAAVDRAAVDRAALVPWALALATSALSLAIPESAGALLLLLLLGVLVRRRAAPPLGLVMAIVSIGVMLPDPDLHVVHLLPAAVGLAVFLAGELLELPSIREWRWPARGFGVALAVWQLVAAVGALGGSKPLSQELVLRDQTRALAALYLTLSPESLVLPPAEAGATGRGPYVREALRYLGPLFGAAAASDPEGGPRPDIIGAVLPGATLLLPRDRQDRILKANAVNTYGVRLDPGGAVRIAAPAGYYAIGALRLDPRPGADASLAALDGCGRRWEALPTGPDQRLALTPFELEAACLPLSLTISGRPGPGTIHLLLPLMSPRLSLHAAATVPTLLDVASRVASPTPIPRYDPE